MLFSPQPCARNPQSRPLGLVLCGRFQPQMAGWELGRGRVLWEGECVLLTEAFITLAAGTSGGGEVLLRGRGLVLGSFRGAWLELQAVSAPGDPFSLLAGTCRVCAGTQETPTEISTGWCHSVTLFRHVRDAKPDCTCLFKKLGLNSFWKVTRLTVNFIGGSSLYLVPRSWRLNHSIQF